MKIEKSMLEISLIHLDTCGSAAKVESNSYEIINNKIPNELVDNFITEYTVKTERVFGKLNTILEYKLSNGFTGVESSSCVDEANYSAETGSKILLDKLKEKIWFGLGFALAMAQNKESVKNGK